MFLIEFWRHKKVSDWKFHFSFFGNSNLYQFSSLDADQRPRPKVLDIVSRLLWCVAQGLIFDPWTALELDSRRVVRAWGEHRLTFFWLHSEWRRTTRTAKLSISYLHAPLCVFLPFGRYGFTFAPPSYWPYLMLEMCENTLWRLKCKISFQYTVIPIANLAAKFNVSRKNFPKM